MNNFLTSTIRLAVVSSVLLFAFVGEALAAPIILTPVSVQRYSDTTILLSANVSNEWKNTNVWFEWGATPYPTTATGMTQVWNKGPFETRLTNLTPGTTYYFRAVGMEDGYTVVSPISSYTLSAGTKTTVKNITNVVNTTNTTNTTKVVSTNSLQQSASTGYTTQNTTATVAPRATSTTSGVSGSSANGARVQTYETSGTPTNANNATAIGAGNSVLPQTLIGWMILLIVIMGIALVFQKTNDLREQRKRTRELEEKKALEEKHKGEK